MALIECEEILRSEFPAISVNEIKRKWLCLRVAYCRTCIHCEQIHFLIKNIILQGFAEMFLGHYIL